MENRKKEFAEAIWLYMDKYDHEMLDEFYDYWTECNFNGRKMRFEKEKTFDLGKRLARWYKNSKKWDNKKPISLAEKMRKQYGLN